MGFEPTRAEHNGLAVHRLNHSATSSYIIWELTISWKNNIYINKYIVNHVCFRWYDMWKHQHLVVLLVKRNYSVDLICGNINIGCVTNKEELLRWSDMWKRQLVLLWGWGWESLSRRSNCRTSECSPDRRRETKLCRSGNRTNMWRLDFNATYSIQVMTQLTKLKQF